MKKLISVFAALALVGSLAAQKKKPAAKPAPAPAAPTVAAPAAPVVAAPAMPAASGSSAGMGLFVEARGSFTLAMGTSQSKATGDTTAASVEYKLSGSNGFGGGVTLGYEIAKGLGLVGSFDYRAISTRKWETVGNTGGTGKVTQIQQQKTNTMVLGIGIRPSVSAFGGTIYAGAGFAYVLPYKNEGEGTATCSITAECGTFTKKTDTYEWNAGMGAYGELGYNYNLSDNLYLGVGVRALVATATNDGKTRVQVNDGSAAALGVTAGTTTTEYSATKTTGKTEFESQGITDISAVVNVGFRF